MLCNVCYGMLRGHKGRTQIDYQGIKFDHHIDTASLEKSVESCCTICRVLSHELQQPDDNDTNSPTAALLTQAELSKHDTQPECYSVKFKAYKPLATFFCQQQLTLAASGVYTPQSTRLDHPEVLRLAQKWLHNCLGPDHKTCPDESFGRKARRYPTRLIELPPWSVRYPTNGNHKVRLVNTNHCLIEPWAPSTEQNEDKSPRGEYVTLSHCWGGARIKKLTADTTREFMDGVPLKDLAPTFREAIDFARRLRRDIRYMWIDALCIIQSEPDKKDWRAESDRMYEVYHNSLLNISATAAENSQVGIIRERDPQELWHGDIDLNVAEDFRNSIDPHGVQPIVKRCSIQDAAFWDKLVDQAPVNNRGWVLQERLLAPRVLHFCYNQIAWECRHFDATESLPNGVTSLGICKGNVDRREQLKSLTPQEYGQRSLARTDRMVLAGLQYWQSIIHKYSRTRLSHSSDRLVALAGIAKLVSEQFDSNARYVAGLWENGLASQLLWKVNVQRQLGFAIDPGLTRPARYIAPSFSWASVETPNGVQCGTILPDSQMLFSITDIHLDHPHGGSLFGAVNRGCRLELDCILEPIEIIMGKERGFPILRWRILSDPVNRDYEHANIVRDCPEDDQIHIQGSQGYVGMRACRGDRGAMIYLLLKQVKGSKDRYRRFGWAQTSPYRTSISQAASESSPRSPRGSFASTDTLNLQMLELTQELERLRQENAAMKASSIRRTGSGLSDPGEQFSSIAERLMPTQRIFLE